MTASVEQILRDELEGLRLLSTAETARVMGVSERTVRRLVEMGELRTTVIGRITKISVAVIRDYIDRNTPGGIPA